MSSYRRGPNLTFLWFSTLSFPSDVSYSFSSTMFTREGGVSRRSRLTISPEEVFSDFGEEQSLENSVLDVCHLVKLVTNRLKSTWRLYRGPKFLSLLVSNSRSHILLRKFFRHTCSIKFSVIRVNTRPYFWRRVINWTVCNFLLI